MLIYLDVCCLKRPFDDQSNPRVRLESEAVLSLLAMESTEHRFVRSAALDLENSYNPLKERAARVDAWLKAQPELVLDRPDDLQRRTDELMHMGFKNFDALHLASAELAGAHRFASCDDRMLACAKRNANQIKVRVMGVIELAQEVIK